MIAQSVDDDRIVLAKIAIGSYYQMIVEYPGNITARTFYASVRRLLSDTTALLTLTEPTDITTVFLPAQNITRITVTFTAPNSALLVPGELYFTLWATLPLSENFVVVDGVLNAYQVAA